MSLLDTLVGTTAGGVIAGLVGLLTTRYDRRLMRREAHLREHKDNLRTIERALLSVREQVWPIGAKGLEDLWLPKWNNPPLGDWLKNYSIANFVSVQESFGKEGSYVIDIDPVLYSDIENHFPGVHSMLVGIERLTRTDGFKLAELLFEVSKIVYEHLSASNLLVLKWTFDQGVKAPLKEIVSMNTNESQWYAGAVFLLVIGEDTNNWPNEFAQLERYGLVGDLQNLAGQIRTKVGHKANEMLRLRDNYLKANGACLSAIELVAHKLSLKGRCEYI